MGTRQLGLISITSQIKRLTLQMFKCSIRNECYAKQIWPEGKRYLFKTLGFFFQMLTYLTPIPFHGS